MYEIKRRIAHDKLGEEYLPGEKADLEGWPKNVLKSWVERGIIVPLEDKSPTPKAKRKKKVSDDE